MVDVLDFGEQVTKPGLTLLNGPGNDMVAITGLAASSSHLVLFSTGRGNPLGGPVPTVKMSSNGDLARAKPHWIDFDAGRLLEEPGLDLPTLGAELFDYVLALASGKLTARNEDYGYREIAIFKDGVTLYRTPPASSRFARLYEACGSVPPTPPEMRPHSLIVHLTRDQRPTAVALLCLTPLASLAPLPFRMESRFSRQRDSPPASSPLLVLYEACGSVPPTPPASRGLWPLDE